MVGGEGEGEGCCLGDRQGQGNTDREHDHLMLSCLPSYDMKTAFSLSLKKV